MGILIALIPALPAQSSDHPDASADGVVASAAPSHGETQVLVAEGDGWAIYADGESMQSLQESQVRTTDSVTPMTTIDCGIVTCSLYLSRAQTQQLNNNINALGGGIAGLAASCGLLSLLSGPAAPIVAVACGAEIAVMGGFLLNAISRAADSNGCLRIRYGGLPTGFYSDHSSFCSDT